MFLALLLSTFALADQPVQGMMILYKQTNCTEPLAAIPVGTSNVNCANIPTNGSYYAHSLKVVGDSTCVEFSFRFVEDVCKAYNGK